MYAELCSAFWIYFFYCYYGQSTTEYYESFAHYLYESNWMDLPNDLQKPYILMITHGQKNLCYSGFGIADLNLGMFARVSWKPILSFLSISMKRKISLIISIDDEDHHQLLFGIQDNKYKWMNLVFGEIKRNFWSSTSVTTAKYSDCSDVGKVVLMENFERKFIFDLESSFSSYHTQIDTN